MASEQPGSGAAQRRRQRRLRSWLRHERMTVAMALAESTHHFSRGQTIARAGMWGHEFNFTATVRDPLPSRSSSASSKKSPAGRGRTGSLPCPRRRSGICGAFLGTSSRRPSTSQRCTRLMRWSPMCFPCSLFWSRRSSRKCLRFPCPLWWYSQRTLSRSARFCNAMSRRQTRRTRRMRTRRNRRKSAAPGSTTMTTLGRSLIVRGSARTGGTSARASPSGTRRGSHR